MKIKELTEQQNIYKHYRPLIIFMLIFLVYFFLFPSAFFCTFILHRDKCYVTCDECMFRCFCPFGMKHQNKGKKVRTLNAQVWSLFHSLSAECVFIFFRPSATSKSSSIAWDRNEANSCCRFPLSRTTQTQHSSTLSNPPGRMFTQKPLVPLLLSLPLSLAGCHPSFSIEWFFSLVHNINK